MGFFKQMKDLKDMAHEAPELLSQTAMLAEAAKANAAAQQGTAPTAPTPSDGRSTTPDAGSDVTFGGVDLALYATIARSFEEVAYDQTRGPELAARHGVGAAQWQSAVDGWNGQIAADPATARRFNELYTGR